MLQKYIFFFVKYDESLFQSNKKVLKNLFLFIKNNKKIIEMGKLL